METKTIHKLPFLESNRRIFELIKEGKKTIETRAGSPEYFEIQEGDQIEFSCGDERILKEVTGVSHYKDIDELFAAHKPEEINPEISSHDELRRVYTTFPGYKQRLKQYGILAFMLGNNMDNNDLFQKVKELKLPMGTYALFGSAPLGVRELKDCHDIDIIVMEDLWNEYKGKNWEIRVMPHGSQYLWNDEIELWKDWKPGQWDIEQLIREAEIINGLPFVKLKRVLEWKKLSGRKKDFKDIEAIEKFLRTQK